MKKKKLKKLALQWAYVIEQEGLQVGDFLTTAIQVQRFLKAMKKKKLKIISHDDVKT